ncbi:hypothetical protein [Methylomicrobium sp. Wu6]|uniref:hypothetical protein n=1 Tax=Methylomicrobium sp. Wu6 TaxID=3107928 RepID=UPI002DD6AA1D|nr:hypothetical protein [Methylomicrobium sp. Wu6]MEC4749420.1 hypothetical protein [Methylomicrobium sp. Wu6]
MKYNHILGVFAIIASTSSFAATVADSGIVSVFQGQTPRLNITNVDSSPNKSCSFTLSFLDLNGVILQPPSPLPTTFTIDGGHGQSIQFATPPLGATTPLRAHIDFSPQFDPAFNPNAGSVDPLNGCYHLIPTFEVSDATSTRVLNTDFYGLPSPGPNANSGTTGKVEICHKPNTPAQKTLWIPQSALKGHLGHGDYQGQCS